MVELTLGFSGGLIFAESSLLGLVSWLIVLSLSLPGGSSSPVWNGGPPILSCKSLLASLSSDEIAESLASSKVDAPAPPAAASPWRFSLEELRSVPTFPHLLAGTRLDKSREIFAGVIEGEKTSSIRADSIC